MTHPRFRAHRSPVTGAAAVLCAAALTALAAGCGSSNSSGSAGSGGGSSTSTAAKSGGPPIEVASVLDKTGPLVGYGKPMSEATRLAVADINTHGGVLGRKLTLHDLDSRSDPARTTTVARAVSRKPDVAVVVGGITSASREAIRPIFDAAKKLYFYAVLYEGGVCDKNTFVTGPTPSQQLGPLLKWAVDHGKNKWYVVAANYNFGQISADWVKTFAKQYGAKIVGGPTFFDLTVSDFSSEIPKIQSSGADMIVSFLVGPGHLTFYKQWRASGLNKTTTIVSTSFGFGNEQVSLGRQGAGIMTAFPYFEQLDTPASQAFVKAWKAAGYRDTITPGAVATWNAWHLWAAAASKAKSIDRDKVMAALESGVSYDGPEGTASIDPPSHHVIEPMRLWRADGTGGFKLDEELTSTAQPTFEQSKCNLVDNPDTSKQFTP
jgi:branched-chain amino acid transport system substrate-binding protein